MTRCSVKGPELGCNNKVRNRSRKVSDWKKYSVPVFEKNLQGLSIFLLCIFVGLLPTGKRNADVSQTTMDDKATTVPQGFDGSILTVMPLPGQISKGSRSCFVRN